VGGPAGELQAHIGKILDMGGGLEGE